MADTLHQSRNETAQQEAPKEITLYECPQGRVFRLEGLDAIGFEFGGKVSIRPVAGWSALSWDTPSEKGDTA